MVKEVQVGQDSVAELHGKLTGGLQPLLVIMQKQEQTHTLFTHQQVFLK